MTREVWRVGERVRIYSRRLMEDAMRWRRWVRWVRLVCDTIPQVVNDSSTVLVVVSTKLPTYVPSNLDALR